MSQTINVINRSGGMLFFTHIKLVVHVLECAYAVARIKMEKTGSPAPLLQLMWKLDHFLTFSYDQGFFQAALLMSIFERRLSFQMLYFLKNNHKIVLQWMWGSGSTVSFTTSSWLCPSGCSGDKAPEKCYAFYVWRVNNSLKLKKNSKLIYFEYKLKTKLLFICFK